MTAGDGQRIDKWLWHARFARTRTAAQRLVLNGDVRVNRVKLGAPSRLVRPGDVLTLAVGRGVRVLRILALAERRAAVADAALLYEDEMQAPAGRARPETENGAVPPSPRAEADGRGERAKLGGREN